MKPTIAVDVRMIRHSGIGIYTSRLLPGVIKALSDYRFLLVGNPELLGDFADQEILDYRMPVYSLKHYRQLPKMLKGGADLLWTPHFNAPGSGIRQLATIHDVAHVARPDLFGSRLKYLVAKWWYAATTRRAERLIAVSSFTSSELQHYFKVPHDKIETVWNFTDPDYADFEPQPVAFTRPFMLTVGNIKPHKNLRCLLQAFDLVRDKIDADLVVVGQSEGFVTADEEVKLALRRGGDRIHFPGFVDQHVLKSMYSKALCTVFPSLYEGFGLGHLESMTLGCPVVASNIPTTKEVCGDAALMFDPTRPDDLAVNLQRITGDAELRESLRASGLERAKLFKAEDSIEQTANIVRSLVN